MELKIPDLAGGLNLHDGLSEVLDNQLTDCKNMWWNNGLLKTRPGTCKMKTIGTVGYDEKIRPKQTNVYIGKYRLFFYNISGERRSENDSIVGFGETGFWLQSESGIIELPTLKAKLANFVCQKKNIVYAFCSCREIWKLEFVSGTTEIVEGWKKAEEKDYYIPVVINNCKFVPSGGMHPALLDIISNGVMFEGYNILTDYYKMEYSTYNPAYATEDKDHICAYHQMYYGLLNDVFEKNKFVDKKVEATITLIDGTVTTHSVTITHHDSTETEPKDMEKTINKDDFMRMVVSQNAIIFYYENGDLALAYKDSCFENNMVITAPYEPANRNVRLDKVFGMTQCEWFGGDAVGLSGGTRLFLCGNEGENKALVMWSGLNEPLYFSENCYAYVGNENQAVTCFGKQGESLIIFKENGAGSFYTSYVQNGNITASDLINQSVIDYTASSVYFPIIQLHSMIGCDCPDTVQLCRNRLVWACSDGKVYTLASQNQYSERNIFCVSEMVERKLSQEDLSNAFSTDFEGRYLLFIKNHVYVMEYESYGYIYIASHSKEENAQIKIPWWYWELPSGEYNVEEAIAVISVGTNLYIVFYPKEPNGLLSEFIIKKLSTDYDTDDDEKIPSMIKTKLFDFGKPNVRKNVDRINLQLGNNGGEAINVRIITECGEESQEIVLTGAETQSYTPGFIDSKAIFPCIRQIRKIGLELSSTGVIAVDGINFKYRTTGGAR